MCYSFCTTYTRQTDSKIIVNIYIYIFLWWLRCITFYFTFSNFVADTVFLWKPRIRREQFKYLILMLHISEYYIQIELFTVDIHYSNGLFAHYLYRTPFQALCVRTYTVHNALPTWTRYTRFTAVQQIVIAQRCAAFAWKYWTELILFRVQNASVFE